jgi:hypothetical protein
MFLLSECEFCNKIGYSYPTYFCVSICVVVVSSECFFPLSLKDVPMSFILFGFSNDNLNTSFFVSSRDMSMFKYYFCFLSPDFSLIEQ